MRDSPLATQRSTSRTSGSRASIEALLEKADVRLDGDRPWDIQLHNPGTIDRALAAGNLGFGEAYMDGWWDCERLDELFYRLLSSGIDEEVQPLRLMLHSLRAKVLNLQTSRRAWQVGEAHYDLGNDFYEAMLDSRMTYSCGFWEHARDLEEAQTAKLDIICRKLGLGPGMRVLDIGCGWGGFMEYAARHYGIECVGLTISREQAALARDRCAGLPVEVRVQDYRELHERFDRLVSIGMFEHVGRKNHREYMEVAARCLDDEGLFLLHTIGKKRTHTTPDAWIDRYIFPNGDLPSMAQVSTAVEDLFLIEDLHNFSADYDPTLMAWHENFEAAWPRFRDRYGERFHRMWRYYLLSCAGTFRARDNQLWQLVLSKRGVKGGYRRPL